ncbi:helix-turn-helix transcriptional regulator [Henriciella litoralis]|uniref:helix-turn-helix transcriptional regulator n=1 Tax=Henriciella litoralis TaxID=568102 RepID=UPI0009FFFC34|nr:response regulator transcription factor [Henriciella litoralis]
MSRKRGIPPRPGLSWRTILFYAGVLAVGILIIQWIEYQNFARSRPGELSIALLAALFLAVGVWAGALLFRRPSAADRSDGNPEAQAALGISAREMDVLELLATGLSNKEIARKLNVSPNTVKTHVARLLEKLEADRRTQAISKARALGLVL